MRPGNLTILFHSAICEDTDSIPFGCIVQLCEAEKETELATWEHGGKSGAGGGGGRR